jgi:hypothetical protein
MVIMHRITLPANDVDGNKTNEWLVAEAQGIVMASVARWSDVTKSSHNHMLGSWNQHAFKHEPGRHYFKGMGDEDRGARNTVTWEFWEEDEAKAFQERFGGEYSVR